MARRAKSGADPSASGPAPLEFLTGPLLRSIGELSGDTFVPGGRRDVALAGRKGLIVPRFYFDDGRDRTVRLPRALGYGHRVDVLEMCLALSGSPLLIVEGEPYRLWDGRLAVLAPGVRHFESCGNRARPYGLLWLIVRARESSMHLSHYAPREGYSLRTRAALGPAGDAAERIARLSGSAARRDAGRGDLGGLKVELAGFAARAARFVVEGGRQAASGSLSEAVARARAFIRSRYAERISIADVAEAAHLSPGYLSGVFKEATGLTVLEDINRLRLEDARARLAGSDEPVKRIAFALGFESQHYFSRFFRRGTGFTPSEFRRGRA